MQLQLPLQMTKGPRGGRPNWAFLHKRQMEVYNSTARYRTVVAGRRWGKTQLSKMEMIREAKRPKKLIWYIAPTYQMARQIMWEDLKETIPRRWVKKINETQMSILLKNGSMIALKGADKPDTLRGVGLDFVVLDEFQDMRPETWNTVIQPTLASTRGRALFIGTPKSFNHLYEHYMRGQSMEDPTWDGWQFQTITSPFILPEEIDEARRNMSEKEFRQEFEASFETMSNRVYHAFDRNKHVKRVKYDPRLPIRVGMDFNIQPMSAVLFQIHDPGPNAIIKVFDEVYLRNSNTFEMSEELERRYWRHKKNLVIYPDPAGGSRSTTSRGDSDFSILRQKGFKRLKYRRKHPRIRDRVNSVNRMLMSADGTVRTVIDHSCKEFIKSLEQTQYKKDSNDINKADSVEHMTDAYGYGVEIEFPVRELRVLGVSI